MKTIKSIHLSLMWAVFVSWIVSCTCGRVERRAGDQSPPGKCSTYKLGGVSSLHWYACCNNCNQTDTTCDGKTYQSASSNAYCGKCGIDTKQGDGKEHDTYSCGGCAGQDRIQKECSTKLRSIYQIPGFCWAFTMCFRRKCESVVPDTCFNLKCDPDETVKNCPTDCCGTVTEKCKWRNDTETCRNECCKYSTCCSGTDGHFANLLLFVVIPFLVKLMI